MMRKYTILVFLFFSLRARAESIFSTDTFTYTINLDLSQNLYLKSVPVDLLKGYCRGDWNAYYPKKEMNQCLFDDFLERYNFMQQDVNATSCLSDYCNSPYFKSIYYDFTRKLKYREVVFYDPKHSMVKREVLWLQVYFSRSEAEGWKHYNGPVFWLREIRAAANPIMISNKRISTASWSLDHEFISPLFIVNENKQMDDRKKINKYEKAEEY